MDSLWGPIFDELTQEGHFSGWQTSIAASARDFEFVGDRETSEEVPPPRPPGPGLSAATSGDADNAGFVLGLLRWLSAGSKDQGDN